MFFASRIVVWQLFAFMYSDSTVVMVDFYGLGIHYQLYFLAYILIGYRIVVLIFRQQDMAVAAHPHLQILFEVVASLRKGLQGLFLQGDEPILSGVVSCL